MAITMEQVKKLREKTGAGVMDCKKALQEKNGDLEKAAEYLREKGIAAAVKKSSRSASEGVVGSYIHMGGKIGVLVEVNCETDFVARNEKFQELVHNLAMQIAAANPQYVSRADVDEDFIAKERRILTEQAKNENKPPHVIEKIVEGRIEKYYAEICLLEQPFIKETDLTVEKLILDYISQLGENIVVNRFQRYEIGESAE